MHRQTVRHGGGLPESTAFHPFATFDGGYNVARHNNPTHRKKLGAIIGLAALGMTQASLAADDNSLTWNGITLYGTVDIGVAHQNHGAPLSQDMYTGLAYMVTKNSNHAITSVAPNGLSQSRLGLKGDVPVTDGLRFVFNLESGFNPESGRLSDALAALVHNNGKTADVQTTGADGSRAGQLFNGPAFAGLASPTFGTLTFGRHNTYLTDAVTKFDPLAASYAFSVLGASGTTAGGGNTQDVRLDDSLKYTYTWRNLHAGALYQFGHNDTSPGRALQLDAGGAFGAFSVDAIYASKKQALLASSLSPAQMATPGVLHDSLAATVSDNHSYALTAAYRPGGWWNVSAGFERITYQNPSDPLTAGFSSLGGYYISFVNDNAYAHEKVLKVTWVGSNLRLTDQLMLTGAWYHYDQDSFDGKGCSDRSASTCSGALNAVSAVFDYRFDKRFDVYAGMMYSHVADGLANGYLFTSAVNAMTGVRVQF